ncbi:hypothetical protein CMV_023923 [Castanea mollissima]|uniref:Fcf2 pre-rRNA processing C-terminal domain-containing protein n=1 Tax=Castanea mollissima TaxID=60419 RepID=A0A8J4QF67_9ROSI|nr:hypothetical protein CMV_023923 [Castanea mollissima]
MVVGASKPTVVADVDRGTTRRVIQNPKLCPCISRTVIESASDFFTGRLTKKERKGTIASEVLSDLSLAGYRSGTKRLGSFEP